MNDVKVIKVARGYGTFIAGSWCPLRGKVLRIGHMGYTASINTMTNAIVALAKAFNDLSYSVKINDTIEAFLGSARA